MGRIKTKLMKRLTYQLLSQHKDRFKGGFEDNKVAVGAHLAGASKKVRNIVAGFATRKMKSGEDND